MVDFAVKMNISELDSFDQAILQEMAGDGRISVTELAQRIGLSKSPTQARLKRLEKERYITGYSAQLDPIRLGLNHVAFVEVRLSNTREASLSDFNRAVRKTPEIEQCHMLAANFDYLLKVRVKDMMAYREVLGEKISALPHVASTSTYVAMQTVKDGSL